MGKIREFYKKHKFKIRELYKKHEFKIRVVTPMLGLIGLGTFFGYVAGTYVGNIKIEKRFGHLKGKDLIFWDRNGIGDAINSLDEAKNVLERNAINNSTYAIFRNGEKPQDYLVILLEKLKPLVFPR